MSVTKVSGTPKELKKVHRVLDDTVDKLPVTFEVIKKKNTETGKTLSRVKCYFSTKWPNNRLEGGRLQHFRRRDSLMVVDSRIMFGDRIVIPKLLRHKVLKQFHSGHPGLTKWRHMPQLSVMSSSCQKPRDFGDWQWLTIRCRIIQAFLWHKRNNTSTFCILVLFGLLLNQPISLASIIEFILKFLFLVQMIFVLLVLLFSDYFVILKLSSLSVRHWKSTN